LLPFAADNHGLALHRIITLHTSGYSIENLSNAVIVLYRVSE